MSLLVIKFHLYNTSNCIIAANWWELFITFVDYFIFEKHIKPFMTTPPQIAYLPISFLFLWLTS